MIVSYFIQKGSFRKVYVYEKVKQIKENNKKKIHITNKYS